MHYVADLSKLKMRRTEMEIQAAHLSGSRVKSADLQTRAKVNFGSYRLDGSHHKSDYHELAAVIGKNHLQNTWSLIKIGKV